MTVKAITLWQPWASAIALGHKRYETRSWKGPDSLIGQALAIHAAARKPEGNILQLVSCGPLPRGRVLCIVTVLGYHRTEEIAPQLDSLELSWGDFTPGRWAWELRMGYTINPPAPAKGAQGIWDWKVEATQ